MSLPPSIVLPAADTGLDEDIVLDAPAPPDCGRLVGGRRAAWV